MPRAFVSDTSRDEAGERHGTVLETPKNSGVVELLRSWCQEDEDEQRETLAHLKVALDENRFSHRKLFP